MVVALRRTQPKNPAPWRLFTFLEFQILMDMESVLLRKLYKINGSHHNISLRQAAIQTEAIQSVNTLYIGLVTTRPPTNYCYSSLADGKQHNN